jgi:hypothetical protein
MSAVLSRVGIAAAAAAIALGSSCLLDFETYDPRNAEPTSSTGTSGADGGTGGATTTTTGGAGGQGGSAGGTAGGGTGGTAGAGPGGGGSGGNPVVVVEYAPVVADCIYVQAPNPDTCLADQLDVTMSVDLSNPNMQEARAYLRFDLDGQLSGLTVTDVQLQLTVSDQVNAASPSSGTLYTVAPFTRMDLFNAAPATGMLLGGDLGAVVPNMLVEWTLPTAMVAPNTSLYFGVVPVNADGIDYWNLMGMVPPKLVVTAQ